MKQLHFATSNEWKFDLAKDYFAKREVNLRQLNIELPESRSEDVIEIAKEKAEYAFSQLNKPLFVNDAALFIKGLNDFPKTYIKFIDKYLGAKGILKLLKESNDRRWEFVNVLYYKDLKREKIFSKPLKGTIAPTLGKDNPKKVRDIDRILIPEDYKKPFSEFTIAEQKDYDQTIWQPTVFDEFIRWFNQQ
jgi:non-canonical purine NTP pyrophosphatase (RdgB/HAM1 family)